MTRAPLLTVKGLSKRFVLRRSLLGRPLQKVDALNGIDFEISEGETLALVGESGCGKTTAGRAILRLTEPSAGSVRFHSRTLGDVDVTELEPSQMRLVRRDMQIVFQDPFSSLNPRMRVGTNIAEPLRAAGMSRDERHARVADLLEDVGLRADQMERYPHELSGGQRQRVAIARSLALNPQFVVADEAVSALDVSIQAQVLNLLSDIQRDRGLSFLFIAHNLAAVRYVSHRIAVMYLGRIVEITRSDTLFKRPRHPYTEALIDSVPGRFGARRVVEGEPPDPMNPPSGCPFRTRCRYAQDICARERPELLPAGDGLAACHFAGDLDLAGVIAEPVKENAS